MRYNQRLGLACLSLLLAASFLVRPVAAIEYGGFGGRPAYPRPDNPKTDSIFIQTLKPGESVSEGVRVINNSPAQKTIIIYSADSTPSTGGAFACEQMSEEKNGVGAWIDLPQQEIILEPGTNKVIDFTIKAPEGASVGEHNGCILMQEKKDAANESQSGVNLTIRTGLRVAVTIPGETVRKLEIVDFKIIKNPGKTILRPQVKNSGTVSVDAEVYVFTRSVFGNIVARNGGQYPILRGETSEWNFELEPLFWGGWYRSNLNVEYDASTQAGIGVSSGQPLLKLEGPSHWIFVVPSKVGMAAEALILIALVLLLAYIWLQRKRQRWIRQSWKEYGIASGEDIQELAKRFDVSWKLLAKVNKLKAPYALKSGDKIKVPPLKKS